MSIISRRNFEFAMMGSTGIKPGFFIASTNRVESGIGISVAGAVAAEVVSQAVLRVVGAARSIEGWPAMRDLPKES